MGFNSGFKGLTGVRFSARYKFSPQRADKFRCPPTSVSGKCRWFPFPGLKLRWLEADHLSPSDNDVEAGASFTSSIPRYVYATWWPLHERITILDRSATTAPQARARRFGKCISCHSKKVFWRGSLLWAVPRLRGDFGWGGSGLTEPSVLVFSVKMGYSPDGCLMVSRCFRSLASYLKGFWFGSQR